jgi:hypothetical protein
MTKVTALLAVAALALGCSGAHKTSLPPTSTTTSPHPAPTTTAPAPPRTTPPSSGYFQVALIAGRNATGARCQVSPAPLDCLVVGRQLGATQDLVASGPPHRNSYGDWIIDTTISQRLVDNINRNLHRPIAFIVDGTVAQIINFIGPVHRDTAGIFNVGSNAATAVELADSLQKLQPVP